MDSKIDIVATLKAMDAVDEFRRHDQAVDHEYDLRASQPKLMEQLRGTYSSQGLTVSDDALKKGIDLYYSGRLTYVPVPAWKRALSKLILHRVLVAAVLVIIMGVLGAATSAVAFYQHQQVIWQREAVEAQKKRLEEAATASRGNFQQIQERSQGISGEIAALDGKSKAYAADGDPDDKKLAESINQGLIQARAALTTLPNVFSGFTAQNITPDNYQQADKANAEASSQLDAADSGVAAANSAITSFAAKKSAVEEAQRALTAAGDIQPKDDDTKTALSDAIGVVKNALASDNPTNIQNATGQLESLTSMVQEHLSINIVNADGVRSGVWRYSNSNPNIKNYYIVVEALNDAGTVVPMSIRNEETGATSTVNYWGERVPEEIYNQVRDDKMSHGFVSNKAFAEKPADSMVITYSRIPKSQGAITNW